MVSLEKIRAVKVSLSVIKETILVVFMYLEIQNLLYLSGM